MDSDSSESTFGGLIDLSQISKLSGESPAFPTLSGKKDSNTLSQNKEDTTSCASPKCRVPSSEVAVNHTECTELVAPAPLATHSPAAEDKPLITFDTSTPDLNLLGSDKINFLTSESFLDVNLDLSGAENESSDTASCLCSDPSEGDQDQQQQQQQPTVQDILLQLRYGGRAHLLKQDLDRIEEVEDFEEGQDCVTNDDNNPCNAGSGDKVSLQEAGENVNLPLEQEDIPSKKVIEHDNLLIDFTTEEPAQPTLNGTVTLERDLSLYPVNSTFTLIDEPSSPRHLGKATTSQQVNTTDDQYSKNHPSRLPTSTRTRALDSVTSVTAQLTEYALMREAWMEQKQQPQDPAKCSDDFQTVVGCIPKCSSDSTISVASSNTYMLDEEEENSKVDVPATDLNAAMIKPLNTTQTLDSEEDCSSRIASEEVCHSTTFSVPEMQSCVEQKQPTSPALPSKPVDRPSMGTKAPHTKRTSLGIGVPKKTQAPLVSRNPAPPKQTTTVSQGVPAPSLTKRRSFLKDPKAISLRKSIVDRSSIPTSAPSNPTRQASGVPSSSIREGPPTQHSEELHTPYEPVPAPSHYQSTPAGTHAQPSSMNPVIGNSNLSFSSIEGSDGKVQQVETDFSDISEVLASRSITPSNKQRRRSGIPTSGKMSRTVEKPKPQRRGLTGTPSGTSPKLAQPKLPRVKGSLLQVKTTARVALQEKNETASQRRTTTSIKGPAKPMKPLFGKPNTSKDKGVTTKSRFAPAAKGRVVAARENY
jgi:hypothetical protein